MPLLPAFLRRLFRRAPAAAPAAPPLPGFHRHEIEAAILHHLEWCVAFNDHLGADPEEAVPRAPLPGPTESGLGRWLGQALARADEPHPLLEELLAEYQRFHHVAQEALALVRAEQVHLASTLLNTDFERSRARVLKLLRSLQRD
jgi:hypothetical protein